MPTSVYLLRRYFDDPRFEGFSDGGTRPNGWGPKPGWKHRKIKWRPRRMAAKWFPSKVTGRVRAFNDYPCFGRMPAFSARAVEALWDLLEDNCELLPFPTRLGTYYACNVLAMPDRVLANGAGYRFFARKVKDLSIFRIPRDPFDTYVTDIFVNRAHEHELQGMDFQKVWPFPKGVNWRTIANEQTKKRKQQGLPAGKSLKGNTLVIHLKLDPRSSRDRRLEKRRLDKILKALDSLLVDRESDAPPIGNLERFDEKKPDRFRIYLSCPDANLLVQRLTPWLKKLDWPEGFSVGKRVTSIYDVRERQVPVRF